jgi:hypothetical protein
VTMDGAAGAGPAERIGRAQQIGVASVIGGLAGVALTNFDG